MNVQAITVTRSFIVGGAIVASLFMLSALPSTSEAHGHKNATSTKAMGDHDGKNIDPVCIAEAVDVREAALIDAWEAFSANMLTALNNRKSALHSAWELTVVKERNAAVVSAWKAWRSEKKDITADFRAQRKAAWATFKSTAKNECKMTTPKDESSEKGAKDSISF